MPIVKISLNDEYYKKISDMAKKDGISIQDYIRGKIFGDEVVFTPAKAAEKAMQKYKKGEKFTLPQLYGDEWTIKRGFAGVFGKQFYNYVEESCKGKIEYKMQVDYGRHAQYEIL